MQRRDERAGTPGRREFCGTRLVGSAAVRSGKEHAGPQGGVRRVVGAGVERPGAAGGRGPAIRWWEGGQRAGERARGPAEAPALDPITSKLLRRVGGGRETDEG